MVELRDLPNELLLCVTSHLPQCRDLANFALTSRRHFDLTNTILYARDAKPPPGSKQQPRALAWAAEHGLVSVAEMALRAGSDVNGEFRSDLSFWDLVKRRKQLKIVDEKIVDLKNTREQMEETKTWRQDVVRLRNQLRRLRRDMIKFELEEGVAIAEEGAQDGQVDQNPGESMASDAEDVTNATNATIQGQQVGLLSDDEHESDDSQSGDEEEALDVETLQAMITREMLEQRMVEREANDRASIMRKGSYHPRAVWDETEAQDLDEKDEPDDNDLGHLDDSVTPSISPEQLEQERAAFPRRSRYSLARYYWTPLHLAIYNGHQQLVDVLLHANASIASICVGLCGCRVLHVDAVANFCSKPEHLRRRRLRPFHLAICRGRDHIARKLLDEVDKRKLRPLIESMINLDRRQDRTKIDPGDDLLLSYGAGSEYDDSAWLSWGHDAGPMNALHCAARMGNVPLMETLAGHWSVPKFNAWGRRVDSHDEFHLTPLIHAYAGGHWDAIGWLKRNGADIDAEVIHGETLLVLSIVHKKWDDALRLLDLGASPSRRLAGEDALTLLCHIGRGWFAKPESNPPYHRLLKRLLEVKAEVNHPGNEGNTALMYAASYCDLEAVDLLIKAGARVDLENHEGKTALVRACDAGFVSDRKAKIILPSVIRKLIRAGAQTDQLLTHGPLAHHTALLAICSDPFLKYVNANQGVEAAVKQLICHGANVKRKTPQGRSAIDLAFKAGRLETCQILLDNGAPVSRALAEKFWARAIEIPSGAGLKFVSRLGYKHLQPSCIKNGYDVLCRAMRKIKQEEDLKKLTSLLNIGVGPTTSPSGETLLHAACLSKEHTHAAAISRLLLRRGLDINARGASGETPLYTAIAYENPLAVGFLLTAGADPHRSSPPNLRPFELAQDKALDDWPVTQYRDSIEGLPDTSSDTSSDSEASSKALTCTIPGADWRYLGNNPLDILVEKDYPAAKEPTPTLYLASLLRLATSTHASNITDRLRRLPDVLFTLYEQYWSEELHPSPVEAGLALTDYLLSFRTQPSWFALEEPEEAPDNDKALAAALHHVVQFLCADHADVNVCSPAGNSVVQVLDDIIARKDLGGWAGRLGSVASGVLAVEVRDGKQVVVFEARSLVKQRTGPGQINFLISDDMRYTSADILGWESRIW